MPTCSQCLVAGFRSDYEPQIRKQNRISVNEPLETGEWAFDSASTTTPLVHELNKLEPLLRGTRFHCHYLAGVRTRVSEAGLETGMLISFYT